VRVAKAGQGINGDGKRHDFRRLYEALGLAFAGRLCGDEAEAEECPYCLKDRFHVNVTDGRFHCKHCGEEGHPTSYLTRLHRDCLNRTTAAHYSDLGEQRGVAPQTLERHELAYGEGGSQRLVPFKASTESVVNLQRYLPGKSKPNKFMLPELPTSIYRFGRLAAAERALAFLVRNRQSRQVLGKDFVTPVRNRTSRGQQEHVSAWLSAVEGLPAVHARLRRVLILNTDALSVIRSEDTPRTLFCCDPPYLQETRTARGAYGKFEMTAAQHGALLEALAAVKGRFLLSGYHSPLYDRAAARYGWRCTEFTIDNKAGGGAAKRTMTECVWSNYPPPGPGPVLANSAVRKT
jgi:hypothetical protein